MIIKVNLKLGEQQGTEYAIVIIFRIANRDRVQV